MSDGDLEGFINDKWKKIIIPKNHVIIFLSNTFFLYDPDNNMSLLHRVPHVKKNKFSLGIFVEAKRDDFLIYDKKMTRTIIDEYQQAYFDDKLECENFLNSFSKTQY